MYTRTYDDQHGILIPESYGGTALSGGVTSDNVRENETEDDQNVTASAKAKNDDSVQTSSFLSKIRLPVFLTNIFKNNNFGLQKIGTEEILLIATASFLFFSKEGDKECAVILLLLLFLG